MREKVRDEATAKALQALLALSREMSSTTAALRIVTAALLRHAPESAAVLANIEAVASSTQEMAEIALNGASTEEKAIYAEHVRTALAEIVRMAGVEPY